MMMRITAMIYRRLPMASVCEGGERNRLCGFVRGCFQKDIIIEKKVGNGQTKWRLAVLP
jgi:hypothetical protein